jgi:hypothetical protein
MLQALGLQPSLEDFCLFTGFVRDPKNPTGKPTTKPLSLGLYVDDFVYFSEDPAVENLFCHLQGDQCKANFILTIVDWFLGVHFLWRITPSSVSVYLN